MQSYHIILCITLYGCLLCKLETKYSFGNCVKSVLRNQITGMLSFRSPDIVQMLYKWSCWEHTVLPAIGSTKTINRIQVASIR